VTVVRELDALQKKLGVGVGPLRAAARGKVKQCSM
jgi:hypothetical protein